MSTWDASQKFLMSFSFYVTSQVKPNRNQSRIWADGVSAEKLSSRESISRINQVLSQEVKNVVLLPTMSSSFEVLTLKCNLLANIYLQFAFCLPSNILLVIILSQISYN